ncbi:hypothetical protein, partial [Pseudomonas syringae group genomosp. 7]|uniref:hypothetical protein n=1 Tax=Pseudomonas syringae group genomosp. 7 TaxID=251699 RepID=UPI00376FF512
LRPSLYGRQRGFEKGLGGFWGWGGVLCWGCWFGCVGWGGVGGGWGVCCVCCVWCWCVGGLLVLCVGGSCWGS